MNRIVWAFTFPPPLVLLPTPANTCSGFCRGKRHFVFIDADTINRWMAVNQLSFKAKRNTSLENVCFERSWFASIYPLAFTSYTCPLCDLQRTSGMFLNRRVWLHLELLGFPWVLSPWLLVQASFITWGSAIHFSPQCLCCFEGIRLGEHKAI